MQSVIKPSSFAPLQKRFLRSAFSTSSPSPFSVYLSGEIHGDWREGIVEATDKMGLPVCVVCCFFYFIYFVILTNFFPNNRKKKTTLSPLPPTDNVQLPEHIPHRIRRLRSLHNPHHPLNPTALGLPLLKDERKPVLQLHEKIRLGCC